jgi:hypothetical protein
MLISEMDGVLFDTCKANLESYTRAAELMGLKTDSLKLETAIHSGESLYAFYPNVWKGITNSELDSMHKSKQSLFTKYVGNIRVNVEFVENYLVNAIDPYLVTRASLSSTKILLEHFNLRFFGNRVIGGDQGLNKIDVFKKLSDQHSLPRLGITVVDDSRHIVEQSKGAGFLAIQYPHFCSLEL